MPAGDAPRVCIIIPFKDQVETTRKCLDPAYGPHMTVDQQTFHDLMPPT